MYGLLWWLSGLVTWRVGGQEWALSIEAALLLNSLTCRHRHLPACLSARLPQGLTPPPSAPPFSTACTRRAACAPLRGAPGSGGRRRGREASPASNCRWAG